LNKLNLTRTYTPEELEQINKYLKVRTNFENGRLISLPQTPIAHEAVVHEISRQLGNWNIDPDVLKTCQAQMTSFYYISETKVLIDGNILS
ncbi:728_t:CDS:2, partial [Rhizophagus irregularis]